MFGDLDWPLNALRGFVSISWASFWHFIIIIIRTSPLCSSLVYTAVSVHPISVKFGMLMRIRFQEWSHDEPRWRTDAILNVVLDIKQRHIVRLTKKNWRDEAESQFTYCLISGSTLYLCKILKILKNNKC